MMLFYLCIVARTRAAAVRAAACRRLCILPPLRAWLGLFTGADPGLGLQGPWPRAAEELQYIIINSNMLQCIVMGKSYFDPELA
jgi:hypothetical protein